MRSQHSHDHSIQILCFKYCTCTKFLYTCMAIKFSTIIHDPALQILTCGIGSTSVSDVGFSAVTCTTACRPTTDAVCWYGAPHYWL